MERFLRAILRLLDSAGRNVAACLVAVLFLISCGADNELDADAADSAPGSLDDVEYLVVASREHTDHDLEYPTTPPAGGDHLGVWHNCGIYTVPLLDEAAVHSLEHGAVWVTYRPDLGANTVLRLTDLLSGREKLLVSPHPHQIPGLVATAWARQLVLDGPDDPRLEAFISRFADGDAAPEARVTCQGGIGQPPADPYGR